MENKPELKDLVFPDGWEGFPSTLNEGDTPVDNSYQGCQFRISSSNFLNQSYAVNIKVTGRVLNYKKFSTPVIRVQIEWVGDGEASTFSGGWLMKGQS